MKVVLLILGLLVAIYLLWLHSLNPQRLTLPLFMSLPPAVVVFVSLALGFAAAWMLSQSRLRQLRRENRRLVGRLQALGELPSRPLDPAEPVIPDRAPAMKRQKRP